MSLTVMSEQPESEQEQSQEFQRFDNFMRKLVRVPVSEVQKLDVAQNQVKAKRVKRDLNSERPV